MGQPLYISDMGRADFEASAAGFILSGLDEALQNAGKASLLLSGGSTPGPVYAKLSETGFQWQKINLGLVDERWVPESDSGSNAALIRQSFLKNGARKTAFSPMKTSHKTPGLGQAIAEKRYSKLFENPTMAVLGMGTDGHVCSWFPQAKGLKKALNPENQNSLEAITAQPSNVTGPYLDRMSLTLSALDKCDKILLLISGDRKKAIMDRVLISENDNLPISHLVAMVNKKPNNPLTILHAA